MRHGVIGAFGFLLFALSASANDLVILETRKIGVEQACSPTVQVTICSSTGSAGVVINAASFSCINVTPSSAVTGPGGCATFTVVCGGVDCGGVVTWTAALHRSHEFRYDCELCFTFVIADESSTVVDIGEDMGDMQAVPTTSKLTLLVVLLLMMAISAVYFVRRQTRA